MDDPREILKAARVEVPEVDTYCQEREVLKVHGLSIIPVVEMGDTAILVLARLVERQANELRAHRLLFAAAVISSGPLTITHKSMAEADESTVVESWTDPVTRSATYTVTKADHA